MASLPEMRPAKYTDGPNHDGFYSAGIDIRRSTEYREQPDWHLHAIEFHSKDRAQAEFLRDFFLTRAGY